ncbi:MAG: hypothetical protein V1880_01115 [Patescibacteria group bacterium]
MMRKIRNKLLKIAKILLIILLVFCALNVVGILIMRYENPAGLHSYIEFGDDKFEVLINGNNGNHFMQYNTDTLVYSVERYLQKGDYLFVTGYHSDEWVDTQNLDFPYFANLIDQGKRIEYYSLEEIPHYMILNVKTAEMRLYRTLDEVPEDQRQYFTKGLNWWCDLMRACYEKK